MTVIAPPSINSETAASPPSPFAGFWARVAAFALDCMILGAIGLALGSLLSEQLVALGPWGRALGFAIALTYFGLLDSQLTGGQSPGKRVLKLCVQDAQGKPLSVGRAMLRFMPLGLAWFPNNAQFPVAMYAQPWVSLVSLAVFGLSLCVLYLLIFNRPSRQSLHDLLVGAYVLKKGETPAPAALAYHTLLRRHQIVCASLLGLAGLAPVLLNPWASEEPFAQLMQVQRALSTEPWLFSSSINQGETFAISSASTDAGPQSRRFLVITAICKDSGVEHPERAQRLARVALEQHPAAKTLDVIQVRLAHGYDIGIASSWRFGNFARTPADWLAPH